MTQRIEANTKALAAEGDKIGVNQALRVDAQSSPDLTVRVRPGIAFINGRRVELTSDTNSPAMVAPSSDPRIDLVTLDDSGAVAIVTGIEDASPVAPNFTQTKLVLATIRHTTAETVIKNDDDATNGFIETDERQIVANGGASFPFFPVQEAIKSEQQFVGMNGAGTVLAQPSSTNLVVFRQRGGGAYMRDNNFLTGGGTDVEHIIGIGSQFIYRANGGLRVINDDGTGDAAVTISGTGFTGQGTMGTDGEFIYIQDVGITGDVVKKVFFLWYYGDIR